MGRKRYLNRRTYLASVAAATVLAGCNGSNSGTTTGNKSSATSSSSKTSATKTSSGAGGSTKTATQTETSTEQQTTEQTTTSQPSNTDQPGSYEPMDAAAASFDNPDAWSPDSNVKAEPDTQNTYGGGQSLHVTGGAGTIRRKFPVPLDLTNKDISLAFDIPAKMRPTNIRIWFKDTKGSWVKLIQEIDTKHPDGWIRINPSINDAAGSTLKMESVLITIDGKKGTPMEYWVDEIRFHEKMAQKGQVMFSFGTISESIYTKVFPVMQDHGMKGVLAVPPDRIGNNGRMTKEQIDEMHDAGWEIASQSNNFRSLYGLSKATQEKRVKYAKEQLKKLGYGDVKAFVYPNGQCDQNSLEVVKKYHDFGFLSFNGSEKGLSQSALMNPVFINRSRPNTPEAVENQLKEVAPYRGLYNIYMHSLSTETHKTQNNQSELRAMCNVVEEYVNDGKVEVVLPSDLKAL